MVFVAHPVTPSLLTQGGERQLGEWEESANESP
jgi:hypothetical protein